MSYLTDAVTKIQTPAQKADLLHVQETESVGILHKYDARDMAKRYYKRDHAYDGPVHIVVDEVDDGWHVMVMEE